MWGNPQLSQDHPFTSGNNYDSQLCLSFLLINKHELWRKQQPQSSDWLAGVTLRQTPHTHTHPSPAPRHVALQKRRFVDGTVRQKGTHATHTPTHEYHKQKDRARLNTCLLSLNVCAISQPDLELHKEMLHSQYSTKRKSNLSLVWLLRVHIT